MPQNFWNNVLLAYKTRTEIFRNSEQKYAVFRISQTPDAAPVKHGGGGGLGFF